MTSHYMVKVLFVLLLQFRQTQFKVLTDSSNGTSLINAGLIYYG